MRYGMKNKRKKENNTVPIGLSDIGLYIPRKKMELEELTTERTFENPKLYRHFNRARNFTSQESIRYPEIWEDTVTMAAEAAREVLQKRSPEELQKLRYLVAGTETGVDHSKPVSAYVEGMLQDAGLNVPNSLSSFQVQHACAGGTMALISVASMLSMSPDGDESGLILGSDIARYETATTAEITQGAGAVSLLVEKNPKLLELDLTTPGYCSKNVDDFFRPLGSKIAQVKGRYSMDCYIDNLKEAVEDHAGRKGTTSAALLTSTDYFVLHAPFKTMPELAMKALLKDHLGLVNGQTESFLESRGLYNAVDPIGKIGNTYSASLYVTLISLLKREYERIGRDIVGKKIMLASYGSGNTMIVYSARVAEGAPEVISTWDLDEKINAGEVAAIEEYETWVAGPYTGSEYNERIAEAAVPCGSFYLSNIREDGYREYSVKTAVADGVEESKASDNLHEPAEVFC